MCTSGSYNYRTPNGQNVHEPSEQASLDYLTESRIARCNRFVHTSSRLSYRSRDIDSNPHSAVVWGKASKRCYQIETIFETVGERDYGPYVLCVLILSVWCVRCGVKTQSNVKKKVVSALIFNEKAKSNSEIIPVPV